MGSGDFIAELIERGQSNLHDVLAEDELVGPAQRAQAEPVVPRARRASRESLGPPDLQTFDHRSIPGSRPIRRAMTTRSLRPLAKTIPRWTTVTKSLAPEADEYSGYGTRLAIASRSS